MNNKPEYRQDEIRNLLERFFDASISQEEMETLTAAAAYFSDNSADICGDPEIRAGLDAVAAIQAASRQILLQEIPIGIEERLDRHISSLARKNSWQKKWLFPISTAAAVALFATIGSGLFEQPSSQPALYSVSEKTAPKPRTVTPHSSTLSNVASATITPDENSGGAASPSKPLPISRQTSRHSRQASLKEPSAAVTPAMIQEVSSTIRNLPPASDMVVGISPVIAAATIDPSVILAQPLSTISQSVENVYESLEIVSRAFSEINMTVSSAAEGISLIAELPLHSI